MKNAVFNDFDSDERQSFARTYTDSAERWLRHLVHTTLSQRYGANYITQRQWKKDLVQKVTSKIQAGPASFPREIDATTFDQLVDIVCHPNYWSLFAGGITAAYPHGAEEARTFLTRIQGIRNEVAHLRPVSIRQLEQALCYSNDIADSIKNYFQAMNMSKEFYVPTFVSYIDSIGNRGHFQPSEWHYRIVDLSTADFRRLYPGDTLTLELEVDPSFDVGTYAVNWGIKGKPSDCGNGKKAVIPITEAHISQRIEIQFKLITTNYWHRSSNGEDDVMDVYYRVLPIP